MSSHSTTVGGSKPLHRFIRGQPKSIGIVVLVLGCSFLFVSVAVNPSSIHSWITPSLMLGSLFIICGILYIVAAHNTTKKTVTISLAMTIVSLLATLWTIIHLSSIIEHSGIPYRHLEYFEENSTESENLWSQHFAEMTVAVEVIFVFYSCVGAIIFIIMSCLAGAALRSTRTQAVIVMTAAAAEPPVE